MTTKYVSAKGKFKVGDENLPIGFSTSVIVRMYPNERDLRSFYDNYKNARYVSRGNQQPSSEQYKMAKAVQEGGTQMQVAAKYNTTKNRVAYAVMRVSIYEFLHATV